MALMSVRISVSVEPSFTKCGVHSTTGKSAYSTASNVTDSARPSIAVFARRPRSSVPEPAGPLCSPWAVPVAGHWPDPMDTEIGGGESAAPASHARTAVSRDARAS